MPWAIRWTDQALRDIGKADRAVAQRIVAKLEEAATDPPRFFLPLQGQDERKLRVGDWRVLAYLSHEDEVVIIARLGHRSTVYRD